MNSSGNVHSHSSPKTNVVKISKREVLRRLLERERDGLSLQTRSVKSDDCPLYVAAIRHFKNWSNVLRALGIDPESVSRRRIWTRERVIRRIHELERQGVVMNTKAVRKVDGSLRDAAYRFFRTWDHALAAAGFDEMAIRCQRSQLTDRDIIKAIQAQSRNGFHVTKNNVRPKAVGCAAVKIFGSFEAALEAAGVAEMQNISPKWSRKKVEAGIQRRVQAGVPINYLTVVMSDPSLYNAARRYHGGWSQALLAVGFDPNSVRLIRRQWTRDDVIKQFRQRIAEGVEPTCISRIRPVMFVKACRKLFGSIEDAAMAAKVNPAKIVIPAHEAMTRIRLESKNCLMSKPSNTSVDRERKTVLEVILARKDAGLPLNYNAVLNDNPNLHARILYLYGRWDYALRAAGIDPEQVRRQRYWSRKAVIERIQERDAMGLPLNTRAVQLNEWTLANAAARRFASWDEALKAAGINPSRCRCRAPKWTRERLITEIKRVHDEGGRLNPSAREIRQLVRTAVNLYGDWDTALKIVGIDPSEVRVHRKAWTANELIKEIQRKHRIGEPLNAKAVRPRQIMSSSRRLFGSWDAVLEAAGLEPLDIRQDHRRT